MHCSAFWGGRLKSTPKVIFWYFFVWFGLISSYLGPLNTENITWVQNGLIWFRPLSCTHDVTPWHIPVANIFQCFSIQMLFWVSCYRLDKKICICPSLTQAVSITDTKYWRPKMKHFQCLNFNLEASFINLMGHKNVGKSVVNSKICFTFEKIMLKSPTFWLFFSTNLSQKHKMFF